VKAAVCISGLPRNVDLCYPAMKRNLFDYIDHDLYVVLWKSNYNGTQFSHQIEHAERLYNAKVFQAIPQEQIAPIDLAKRIGVPDELTTIFCATKRTRTYFMYQGIKLCYQECIASGKTYDSIIRLRTDISTREPYHFRSEPGCFYTVCPPMNDVLGVSDICFYGSPEIMLRACTLGDRIMDYAPSTVGAVSPRTGGNLYFSPHLLLKEMIRVEGWRHVNISKDYRLRVRHTREEVY